ncbi:MAG TPA: molybdenum cofactor guanylyltransferase [Eubacteriaceae bacterium]|jgi:molybdopterin-guanine dinucleotide biosynthesis protein A|nr:molybdenum cofactor guanylyltransferase [Eubacteriaceae bacterium]
MKDFGCAIVLAGGNSQRMGFDKQKIILHNNRLMDRITEMLAEEFEQIIIVTNVPDIYKNSPYIITKDEIKNMGPLGGIYSGLKKASSLYSYVIACDMPVINMEYIHMMKERITIRKPQACVARYKEWIEPFNAFYSSAQIEKIEECLGRGERSVYNCLKGCDVLYIEESDARKFSPNWDMFYNLNTRGELASYLANAEENG